MKMFDLHGVKHSDVTDIMIDVCSKYAPPFIVITGKSGQMKRIVSFAVSKFGFEAHDDVGNFGRVVIRESR